MPIPIEVEDINDENPQPVDHLFTFGDAIGFDASAAVFVRQNWGDAWTANDQLVCTDLNWTASPSVPTASLNYRYGHTLERDGSLTVRPKLAIGGWYVRIVVTCEDGERVWHGFVDDSADMPAGYVARADVDIDDEPIVVQDPTGTQIFSCVGMVAALDRSPIRTTFFRAPGTFDDGVYTDFRVALSAPTFNPRSRIADEPGELRQIPNRYGVVDVPEWAPTTEPVYPADLPDRARTSSIHTWPDLYTVTDVGEYWSTESIVQYLACFAGPKDGENKERIPVWVYDPDSALPDWDRPSLDCEGMTLKGALDQLMSLKHAIGYWVWVDDLTNRVIVQPFTALVTALTVDTGKTIAANARYLDIVCDTDPATSSTVQKSESGVANQVIVRGAKRIFVTTLAPNGGSTASLVNGWSSTLATDYNTEFGALLSSSVIRERNAARDALEQGRYKALWRNFVIPPNWNWLDPFNVDMFAIDYTDDTGNYVYEDRYLPNPARIRILPHLPLKCGVDYLAEDAAAQHLASKAQFREMEVYGKSHGAAFSGTTMTGSPTIWSQRSKRDVLYSANDPDYSIEAKPLQSDVGLGVRLNVVGAFQGVLGGNSGASHIPILPTTSLLITVAIEEDRHIDASWPATVPDSIDGTLRRVYDFGDEYQRIEMAEKTVVGIAGDEFQKTSTRVYVRDDYVRLLELAKQLHQWATEARNVVRISSRRATARLWPGQVIRDLNPSTAHEVESNCAITEVAMSFPIGNAQTPGKPSMHLTTSRGEMDLLFFQPKLS